MPLYDIYCEKCGKTTEVLLKVDEPIPDCSCGGIQKKECNCKSFKLVYDPKKDVCSWGHDNYATTQRYRYVSKKEAKE